MPESEIKPARHPSPLSAEYHKARKQLMLWSAILFIWELVGIDLEKAKEAGGNTGALIGAIKSPQAIPWALLILVFYFLIKCWIEWAQSHPERRRVTVARVDFYLAGFVAALSIALYGVQAIRRVQFANLGSQALFKNLIGVVVLAIVSVVAAEGIWRLGVVLLAAQKRRSLPKKSPRKPLS